MASRYTNARRAWVPNKNYGLVEIVYRKPPVYDLQPYTSYMTNASDTMDSLAWKFYGDPNMWYQLADMNPGVVCPDDLSFGTLLHIPVISNL